MVRASKSFLLLLLLLPFLVSAFPASNVVQEENKQQPVGYSPADLLSSSSGANDWRSMQSFYAPLHEAANDQHTTSIATIGSRTFGATNQSRNEPNANGEKIFAYPFESYRLKSNDLQVIIVPLGDDYPGLVSVHVTVKVGSRDELEEGKTGFAHFFEHAMFRGSSNISQQEFQATYQEMGARYNAWTNPDSTNYYNNFPKLSADGASNLDTVLMVESDRFKYSNYTEEDFKIEAGAILGEFNGQQDKTWQALLGARMNISYPVHSYGHSVLGTLEDIRDMPNEFNYSRYFFDRFYKPQNTILMVFGDVAVNETKAMVERHWGNWKAKEDSDPPTSDIPEEPIREGAVYQRVEWPEASTPWLSVSFNAANFTVDSIETVALDIIQFMFLNSFTNLFQELIVKDQTTSRLNAWHNWGKNPNLFVVEANVASIESIWEVRDKILQAFAKFRVTTVSREQLDRVTTNMKYLAAMRFVSTDAIASDIQYFVSLTGDPESINKFYALYDTITPSTLLEVANKYFTDNRLATVSLAYSGDELPVPPRLADNSATDHAYAGSVDSIVRSIQEDVYPIDSVILKSESSRLVNFDVRFRVGASDDPPGKEGISALVSNIIDMYSPTSAKWSATTGKEYTYFEGMTHVDNLDSFYKFVQTNLLKPLFTVGALEQVRLEAIRSIESDMFNDGAVAARAFDASVFEGHPFSQNTAGTVKSLERITLDDVNEFYQSRYTRQNVILGLGGAISEQFSNKVLFDLQQLPDGPVDKDFLLAPSTKTGMNAVIVEQAATQATTLMFGFALPFGEKIHRGHPDYIPLSLALNYYGIGMSSILMKEIRAKRGINYGNSAHLRYGGLALSVSIGAVDTTELAHFTTRLAMYELHKLLLDGLDQESFEFFRNSAFNGAPAAVETQAKLLSLAMEGKEYGFGDAGYLDYITTGLKSVTLEDVNHAVRKWFQDTDVFFVYVTPDAEDLKARLINEATSKVAYTTEGQPEEVSRDDKIIQEYVLGFGPDSVKIKSASDLFQDEDGFEVSGAVKVRFDDNDDNAGEDQTPGINVWGIVDVRHDNDEADVGSNGTNATHFSFGRGNGAGTVEPHQFSDSTKGDDVASVDLEMVEDGVGRFLLKGGDNTLMSGGFSCLSSFHAAHTRYLLPLFTGAWASTWLF